MLVVDTVAAEADATDEQTAVRELVPWLRAETLGASARAVGGRASGERAARDALRRFGRHCCGHCLVEVSNVDHGGCASEVLTHVHGSFSGDSGLVSRERQTFGGSIRLAWIHVSKDCVRQIALTKRVA